MRAFDRIIALMMSACAFQTRALCVVVAVLGAAPASAAPAQRSQTNSGIVQVYTGTFITLDSLNPRVAAIAVRDGRIIALGSRAQVDSAAGKGARHTRLAGTVLPGLADAHVHAPLLGENLGMLDLRGLSKAGVLARVHAAALRAPAGAWIRGMGWDQSYWSPPEFPRAAELDGASAGHPVLLERIDGHAVWVNSRAMQLADITSAAAEPPGGRILRGASGAPTGVFVDDAIDLVRRAMPALSMSERVKRLRRALAQYAAWGLTSIHDAGIELADIEAYHALSREGPLPVRVYAMSSANDSTLRVVLARGPELGLADGTFTLRTVKIVDDGALGSRGARLSAPYSDEPSQRGLSLVPPGQLDSIIARSTARGFQVAVHAIGDASTTDVLNAIERSGAAGRNARFRLEHASMIRDDDLPRLAKLGVIASMQPVFVGEYSRFAEARVGKERLPWVYRTRDVVESGAVVAAGTDYPAADAGDPIGTLFSMVTRQGVDGRPRGGWLPGQRVSVDVALRSMTMGAAYAAFEENDGGILRVGRRADLTVLSANPYETAPDQLRSLRVLRTIVGGRTTYDRCAHGCAVSPAR